MKFPSLQTLTQRSTETLIRFPMALLSAVVGTTACMYLTGDGKLMYEKEAIRIAWVCVLGLPLFTALRMFFEKKKAVRVWYWGSNLAGVILLAIYYYVLLQKVNEEIEILRYSFYLVFLHLLVAVAPYTDLRLSSSFWQYNKSIFLRILLAALYTCVLYLGIIVALISLNELFDLKIPGRVYGNVALCLFGIFNTWFFLAGVPSQFHEDENETSYPTGLKIFTQYVLLPLVVLYLSILYAYTAKIVMEWSLPRGWVSYLVLGFSTAGILSLLLIHPVKDRPENKWMKVFSRCFYMAILPLVVLLLVSIGTRIQEYGITEHRYVIAVLGSWLAGIAFYFIISSQKNIKLIPMTLAFLCLFASFGPWGAFQVSLSSQKRRLESILKKYHVWQNESASLKGTLFNHKDGTEIKSLLDYLYERDTSYLTQVFHTKMAEHRFDLAQTLELRYDSAAPEDDLYGVRFECDNHHIIDLVGYDYMLSGDSRYSENAFTLGAHPIVIYTKENGGIFKINYEREELISLHFLPRIDSLFRSTHPVNYASVPIADSSRTFYAENNKVKIKLLLNDLQVNSEKEIVTVNDYTFWLFLSWK